jgi:hypothetical protein
MTKYLHSDIEWHTSDSIPISFNKLPAIREAKGVVVCIDTDSAAMDSYCVTPYPITI